MCSRRNRFGFYVVLMGLFMTDSGCNPKHSCEAPTLVHSNGLSLCPDERVKRVEQLADGYRLRLNQDDAREINEITVRVTSPDPRSGTWQERTIGGRSYRFSQSKSSEGSGGDEHTLSILVPTGERTIVVVHHLQTTEAPDFDGTWQLAETARLSQATR